jgi:broad specificity phosphatase PhoE
MTKLYYVTHPSVQIDPTISPELWDISEKGRAEAQELLKQNFWSEIDYVFTSNEPKSRTVGDIIAGKYGITVESIQDLGEANRSKTHFLPLEEYMQTVEDAYRNPNSEVRGWESHHHMYERNKAAVEDILKQHRGKTIAIIGHGGAGTCVKCYIADLELNFNQDPKRTGCIFVADIDERKLITDWYPYVD